MDLSEEEMLDDDIDYLNNIVYCPVCKRDIDSFSRYLLEVFTENSSAYQAAVLVMHYRHEHIKYYDLSWQSWSYAAKNKEYSRMSHENYKIIVNNRAKRQLIRNILIDPNIDFRSKRSLIKGFNYLQNNDEKVTQKIKDSLISIEMNEKKCEYCNRPAKYIIHIDNVKKKVCGIHKRKKEFKKAKILELKNEIERLVDTYLSNN